MVQYVEMIDRDPALSNGERCSVIRERVLEDFEKNLDPFLENNFLHNPDLPDARDIKQAFIDDCRDQNLGQRFALFLTNKYKDTIKIAKLASTKHRVPDESQRLYREYKDFAKWIEDNTKERELDRIASDRQFSVKFVEVEPYGEMAVVLRTRPLIMATVNAERSPGEYEPVDTIIYKETLFAIPAVEIRDLAAAEARGLGRDPSISDEQDIVFGGRYIGSEPIKQYLERALYPDEVESDDNGYNSRARNSSSPIRIYTAYFAESKPIAA